MIKKISANTVSMLLNGAKNAEIAGAIIDDLEDIPATEDDTKPDEHILMVGGTYRPDDYSRIEGAQKVICDECHGFMWLAPSGMVFIEEHPQSFKMCGDCYLTINPNVADDAEYVTSADNDELEQVRALVNQHYGEK